MVFVFAFLALTLFVEGQSGQAVTVCQPMITGGQSMCIQPVDATPLGRRMPILLIHGWQPSRPGAPNIEAWNNLITYFNQIPWVGEKFKFYHVAYYSNLVSVSDISKILASLVDQMDAKDADFAKRQLFVISHSMGGLVARSFMEEQRLQSGRGQRGGDRVSRLVILATPHHGTPVANGPARDVRAGILLSSLIEWFDEKFFGGVQWADYNRFDLRADNYASYLDFVRFPQDQNVWLDNLNSRSSYMNKLSAYGGVVNEKDSLRDCVGLDFGCLALVMNGIFNDADSDGVVYQASALARPCSGCVSTEIFWGWNHLEMVSGRTPSDSYLLGAILGDLSDFATTSDGRFGGSVTMGDSANEAFHNIRGWGEAGRDSQGVFRNEPANQMVFVDLFVRNIGVPYILSFKRAGNACDGNQLYVYIMDIPVDFLYPGGLRCKFTQGSSLYEFRVPDYAIKQNRVRVGFIEWRSEFESKSLPPMYYVRLE
ncbi:MAG: hypothetical protein AAB638_01525 [Patescibacteria group bacterium]